MATHDEHLQRKEKAKLIQESTVATPTEERIDGDKMVGELIQKLIILIPMVADPHDQLGPSMMRFLFGSRPKTMTFKANCKNTR